jgi:hypothetical protein
MQMEKELMKLPLSVPTFEEMREENYVYVDKTRFLVNMIDRGKSYFFARPRRFGKSLTVSTLRAMFSGKRELFRGLYAEEFMNRADYCESPVIRLDMSKSITSSGIDYMKKSIVKIIAGIAELYGIETDKTEHPAEVLETLITKLAATRGKVVVLLDEYDKPYTDFYRNPETADKIREVLRDFYLRIKANDEHIRFVFITGIAKFAKFGVFSGLNSPTDISMNGKYGEMCGFTEEEIVRYFPEYIEKTAMKMNCSPDRLLEMMRDYYDGFCFDGVHRLYNPISTLNFFEEEKFGSFWMESGRSRLIADYLRTRKLTVEQFRNFIVSQDFARHPGEPDLTPPAGFLYQTGYLTIREESGSHYILDYPNREVLNGMSAMFAQSILPAGNSFEDLQQRTLLALEDRDEKELVKAFNALLSSIPYDDFAKAGELSVKRSRLDISVQEWLYRSSILAFLRGCGVATVAEMHTNLGRPDLVIEHGGNTFAVELRVAYKPEDVPAKLAAAVKQIKDRNYLGPYFNAVGVAMVIDDEKRQITAHDVVVAD